MSAESIYLEVRTVRPLHKLHIEKAGGAVAESPSGAYREAACDVLKPVDKVLTLSHFRQFVAWGYSQEVFCGHCLPLVVQDHG